MARYERINLRHDHHRRQEEGEEGEEEGEEIKRAKTLPKLASFFFIE